jgi:hypothetical protein
MDGDAGLIAAAAVNPICLWCEGGFDIRKGGGAPQRFCQPKCRDAFHSAGRRWAEMAVLSGVITVGDLRNGSGAPCKLAGREEGASDYPATQGRTKTLSARPSGRVCKRCSSNSRSHQTAFSTFVGSAGSIQIRRRTPKLSAMRWRS